jgi:hypothetical protein
LYTPASSNDSLHDLDREAVAQILLQSNSVRVDLMPPTRNQTQVKQ